MKGKKILVVSAHPDDAEIGMGGTIAKLSDAGNAVISVILTDGRRAPNPTGLNRETMAALRKQESGNAMRILGVQENIFFDLDSVANQKNYTAAKRMLEEIFASHRLDQIFTLHPKLDRHATHRLAGKLTMEVCKRSKSRIWAYEVWGLFATWDRFEDISAQIDRKLMAIDEHKSQLAAIPYKDGIRGLNRWRAIFADPKQTKPPAEFAEVFLRLS